MGQVSTIGPDSAKWVFHAHGADASSDVVSRRRPTRAKLLAFFAALPSCTAAMEACAGAHDWARGIGKLGQPDPRRDPPL